MTPNRGAGATTQDVLVLVQRALDDIDSVPLEATVRRTVRIANLLGETQTAVRMAFEVKATGGHPPSNAEATRRLLSDPTRWADTDGEAEKAISEYMAERTNDEGLVISHSLAEIEFWQNERTSLGDTPAADYALDLAQRSKFVQLQTRARHHAFTLLCGWERQLTFATTQASALDAVSKRVDALLNAHAPDVLNQFNAAFRRLRDASSVDSEAFATEELSQALTSCRRILKAVVDIVQPSDPARPTSPSGHSLTDDQYKNRLVEFLTTASKSDSFRTALTKAGETLFDRFSAVDALSSKGVHATVAAEEAEFCALHTYLLAGEVLLLHADATAPSGATSGAAQDAPTSGNQPSP